MDRRERYEDMKMKQELQTYDMAPERWHDLYFVQRFSGLLPGVDGQEEIPVTNLDDIDEYFKNIEKKRFVTGAQLNDLPILDGDGWSGWI